MHLITGSTGTVGSELATALVAAGEEVRSLTRGAGAVPAGTPVRGDLDRPGSLRQALEGVEGLFLLPGYDTAGVVAEAERAGVQRLVLLSSPAAGIAQPQHNAVARYMLESEEAVRAGSVPWTVVRPTSFMSNVLRWMPQLADGDVLELPFTGAASACVDPADIAAVAAAALTGSGHAGRVLRPTGPEALRPADQVAVLAEVLGRPLELRPQSAEEARRTMAESMPADYVEAFLDFFVGGSLDESPVLPDVRETTGRAPRSFRDWAGAHATALRTAAGATTAPSAAAAGPDQS